jgi:hypothetical protein
LVENLGGNIPPGRHRQIWEDDVKTDLRETVGRYGLDLSGSG